jgi:hypothetical protein
VELESFLEQQLARLPPERRRALGDPDRPLRVLEQLGRPLLQRLARRLERSGAAEGSLPPEPGRGRWLRRLRRRLLRLGSGEPAGIFPEVCGLERGQLLLLGGLLAAALTRLGQQHPQRCGGALGPNPSLATSLEQLDRHFRLKPGWVLSLELEPLLSAGAEPWWRRPSGGPAPSGSPPGRVLEGRLRAAGAGGLLLGSLRLLGAWGLRPHYPAEALPLEEAAGYADPPPLAPLGEGLLGLLLEPLDGWALQRSAALQRGTRRRQNPAYTRLLYLERRLRKDDWSHLPPARRGWRPREGEPGLDLGAVRERMSRTPSRDPQDPHFRRHRYLRHGSRLLLGMAAPAKEARRWSEQLLQQLEQDCGLRPPLPRLRPSSCWLSFRGFRLRAPPLKSSAPRRGYSAGERCFPRLALRAPVGRLARWLGRVGLLG